MELSCPNIKTFRRELSELKKKTKKRCTLKKFLYLEKMEISSRKLEKASGGNFKVPSFKKRFIFFLIFSKKKFIRFFLLFLKTNVYVFHHQNLHSRNS